jgi:pantetheine-phosphate adenylyltransferase
MKELVLEVFKKFNINPNELLRYDEPHRFYHNWNHIEYMLLKAQEQGILSDELLLAIIFHDIIYNPKNKDNEEKSAELFRLYVENDEIKYAILDTKDHVPNSYLSTLLCRLDLDVLYSDIETFIKFEDAIFKEYQFIDYKKYKEHRLKILENYNLKPEFLDYIKYKKPNIAVYAGTFSPFHRGHLNILEKAEKIFDKVIIARGINTEKNNVLIELPEIIKSRQVEFYDGLLTDFLDTLEYDVTLIRGLRNITDLQYELTQYRFLQDLKPNIKVVSIFCDKEYEHISSSAIRLLEKYNKSDKYLL